MVTDGVEEGVSCGDRWGEGGGVVTGVVEERVW